MGSASILKGVLIVLLVLPVANLVALLDKVRPHGRTTIAELHVRTDTIVLEAR